MLACHIHSTDNLQLDNNILTGPIPTEIAMMSNLCESSVVWLLVVMIVLSCVFFIVLSCLLVMVACCNDCVVMCFSLYSHACFSYSFYR